MNLLKKYIIVTIHIFTLCLFLFPCSPLYAKTNISSFKIAIFSSENNWNPVEFKKNLQDFLVKYSLEREIIFPKNMDISLSFIDGKNHSEDYAIAAKSLMDNKEISFIISVGSLTTQALLQQNNKITPVIALVSHGATSSKYIPLDSKNKDAKNFIFSYDKDLWLETFSSFYMSIPFKRIGIIYPPIEHGRSFSGIGEMQEIARDFGFELIQYKTKNPHTSPKECEEAVNNLIEQGIDAIYLSPLLCFNFVNPTSNADTLLDVLHKNKIRTFAGIAGSTGLQLTKGALMSVSNFRVDSAETIFIPLLETLKIPYTPTKDLTKLNRLTFLNSIQSKAKLRISFNLATAQTLGITIPLTKLITADGLFNSDLKPIKPITNF